MQRKHMPGCGCCGCISCNLPIRGYRYEITTDTCGVCTFDDLFQDQENETFLSQNCYRNIRIPVGVTIGSDIAPSETVNWWTRTDPLSDCVGTYSLVCDCECAAEDPVCPSVPSTVYSSVAYQTGAKITQRWTPIAVTWVEITIESGQVSVEVTVERHQVYTIDCCLIEYDLDKEINYACVVIPCGEDSYSWIVEETTTYSWTAVETCTYNNADHYEITRSMIGIDGEYCGIDEAIIAGDQQPLEPENPSWFLESQPSGNNCQITIGKFRSHKVTTIDAVGEAIVIQSKTDQVDWCVLEYDIHTMTFGAGDDVEYDPDLMMFGTKSVAEPYAALGINGNIQDGQPGCNEIICEGGNNGSYLTALTQAGTVTLNNPTYGCNWDLCTCNNTPSVCQFHPSPYVAKVTPYYPAELVQNLYDATTTSEYEFCKVVSVKVSLLPVI